MTYVEFLNYVIENVENAEAVEVAKARLAREAKAKETQKALAEKKAAEKKAQKAEVFEKAYAVLGEEPKTATEIVEALAAEGVTITRQAIPPLFKEALAEGKIVKENIKVEKKTAVGYKLA